jgi:hypothetical protein
MFGRTHNRRAVDDADLFRLQDLYGALGLGFPAEAVRVFGGEDGRDGGDWCLYRRGRIRTLRCLSPPDLSSHELFSLPSTWEITRVVARDLTGQRTKHGDLVSVGGDVYCRARGSWDTARLPFYHLWTMCAGRALRFENLLDGTELKRRGRREVCAA